jgi:hypothetical protein
MKKTVFTAIIGLMTFTACDKEGEAVQEQRATVQVRGDNSPCNILIRLESGVTLYPVNSEKVSGFTTNGARVMVSYKTTDEYVSPCQSTEPAIIEEIRSINL